MPAKVNADGSVTDWSVEQTGSLQKRVILANALAITTTTTYFYDLITNGGMTEEQIRQYKEFKISINNTHNQAAALHVRTALLATTATSQTNDGTIYTEPTAIPVAGTLIIQAPQGGVGASANQKVVPALRGLHSNILLRVAFATAPTSGSLTIVVEMQ